MELPNIPEIKYWHSLVLAAVFEIITIFNRFVLGLRAVDVLSPLYLKYTLGIRIYHAYPGALMVLLGWLALKYSKTKKDKNYSRLLIVVGIGLILSDAIHHFIVLPATIGTMEFV